jgi:hypothetical protein
MDNKTIVDCPFGTLFDDDDYQIPHDGHVLVYNGFDVVAAIQGFEIAYAPCPYHAKKSDIDPHCLFLDSIERHDGTHYHFVICGDCGARGPSSMRQSEALLGWNNGREERVVYGAN